MQNRAPVRNAFGIIQPMGYPALPEGWETETDSFRASDGVMKLFAYFHHRITPAPIRRILVVAHGFGEHAGRYLHFPHFLGDSIDAVYSHDHRGHGRSDGLRGDAVTFASVVDDMKLVVERVQARFPEAELHFLGHSFGGHVGLRMGFLYPALPLKTFQISSPFLALFREPAVPVRALAGVLARSWGTLSLSSDIDPKVVSRDEAVILNYGIDKLNHARMTSRLYASMVIAQKDTRRRTSGLGYPLKLHLVLADELVSTAASRRFYDALDNPGKELFEYPEFRHEPMNEIGKELFFENMKSVIDASKN